MYHRAITQTTMSFLFYHKFLSAHNIIFFQVIVGGVNLLEQAEEQERLLDKSAKELEKRKRKEKQLRSQLEQKEAEKLNIEERYANLQEEAAGKTKRLKEVWKQFQQTKEEVDGR